MNQAKFNKIMKIKYKNNVVTQSDIDELYEKNTNSIFFNKSIEELIKINFEDLVIHRAKGYLEYIVYKLMLKKELMPILEDKFLFIIKEAAASELNFILGLKYDFDISKIINDNFEYLLNNFAIKKLIVLNANIILTEENKILLDKKYNDNQEEFASSMLLTRFSEFNNVKDKENLESILMMIIKEIKDKEKVRFIDIKKLNGGNYSNVIEIGDKILKIGSERMRFNIPNNEHILVPIIRKDLSIISDIPMVIEVSERVDTKVNLTDDELYQIYKDLRINGIIWTDVKNDNLGRLLKDNIVHYDNVLLDNEAKGIEGTNTKTLKKGEYVIIDTDFIYDEDDENIKWGNMKSMMFETRYVNELNNKENVHKM